MKSKRSTKQVTMVRASCPSCGDVELTSRDVRALVCSADDHGSYAFQCPECLVRVTKDADARIIDLLVSSGVELVIWDRPAELDEVHVGDTITHDDLLEFHHQLQQEGWFERLATAGRS